MKLCGGKHGCGRLLPTASFRLLSHGYLAAYCGDCERAWDRERFQRRITDPVYRSQRRRWARSRYRRQKAATS